MNGGAAVVESLRKHGVEFVFGLVDTTILDILDALHDVPSIRYVSTRHEQVASMMADGYARVTGRPGICVAQCGPGAMNLLYGTGTAFRDSVPLIAITGNIDSHLIGRDSWHDLDVVGLYAPVTKWSTRVTHADDIPEVLDRAFHVAMSGRRGPVHVNIPRDLQAAQVSAQAHSTGPTVVQAVPAASFATDADRAFAAMAGAERPLILAGGGVVWANATAALTRFSELTGIPVAVTDTARGAIPENHANALGPIGFFGSKAASDALKQADAILGLGTRFPDLTVGADQQIMPSATIIQNNIDPGEIGRRIPVTMGLVSDAGLCLQAMLERAGTSAGNDAARRTSRTAALKAAVDAERDSALADPPGPAGRIPIQAVIRELMKVLDESAILAIDGGLHTFFSARLPIRREKSYLVSSGLGSMGFALPAAMGAKLACPGRPAVALVGDGGFAMVSQDLETAIRCEIPVVIVIYNNGGFGAQRLRQERFFKGRTIGTTHGNPDFAALAKLYGAQGTAVHAIEEFAPALEAALRSNCTSVLDVHTA